MPNANFTPTTDANAIPTIIAQEVIRQFPGYMGVAKFVSTDTDWTGSDFASYGDTLNIVKPGSLTVKTKTPGTEMESQAPTADKISVTLNRHKYIDILDEDITKMLRKPNLQEEYAMRMAIELAEDVEEYLLGLHASITGTVSWDHTSATTIESSFKAIRSWFARRKIPKNLPKLFAADTSVYDNILGVDKYTSGDYVDKGTIGDGEVRPIYKIYTHESQMIQTSGSPVTYHNMAMTKFGMVLVNRPMPLDGNGRGALQRNMTDPNTGLTFRLTESYSHGNLGSRFSLDLLYGGAIADQDHIVEVEST
jgi:hypothetical protein